MARPPRTAALGVALAACLVAVVGVVVVRGVADDDRRGADGDLPAVSAEDGVSEGIDPERADVVVIGDSVTDQSSEEIVAAMGEREVSVIGLSGYRTDELLPTIEDALAPADRPTVAVVMSGYNDLMQRVEEDAPVDEAMGLLSEVDCAIWVAVPTKGLWEQERAEAFDRRVRDAAEDEGVVVETAWRDAVDDTDGPAPSTELASWDKVHPSPAGRQELGRVMADAVDGACDP